jgi:drug/metabolite transporter (DMT)-like permease
MASIKAIVTRERALLAGDGVLLTATVFGLALGGAGLLAAPDGAEPAAWVQVLSVVLSLGAVIAGPIAAWVLHGRRVTWIATLGAVIGGMLAGVVVQAVALLSWLLGLILSPLTNAEYAGPLAVAAVIVAAFVALVVWLVADSARDLRREPREHARLDVVRLVSVAAFGIFVIGVVLWMTSHPDDAESGEAAAFAIAAGVVGGLATSGAEVSTALAARKRAVR